MIEFARSKKEPPSSRGPGRIPFKDKTGVRISVGAQTKQPQTAAFCFKTEVPTGGMLFEYPGAPRRVAEKRLFCFKQQSSLFSGYIVFKKEKLIHGFREFTRIFFCNLLQTLFLYEIYIDNLLLLRIIQANHGQREDE